MTDISKDREVEKEKSRYIKNEAEANKDSDSKNEATRKKLLILSAKERIDFHKKRRLPLNREAESNLDKNKPQSSDSISSDTSGDTLNISKNTSGLPKSVKTLIEKYSDRIESGNFTMTELNSIDPKLYMSLYSWNRRGNDLSRFIPLGKSTPGPKAIDDGVDPSSLDPSDPRDKAYLDAINRRAFDRRRKAFHRTLKA